MLQQFTIEEYEVACLGLFLGVVLIVAYIGPT